MGIYSIGYGRKGKGGRRKGEEEREAQRGMKDRERGWGEKERASSWKQKEDPVCLLKGQDRPL